MSSHGIRRSDGQWYAGTVDRNPVFTADGTAAAFPTTGAAKRRMKGLVEQEKHGHTFKVLPLGDFHAG